MNDGSVILAATLAAQKVKKIPGSAAQRAETAQEAAESAAERAETAADTVTSATVAETKTYLGIT